MDTELLAGTLLEIGQGMVESGAEISRVEDTLSRIGYAYGASAMNVFVITSSMMITMEMPEHTPVTMSRRLKTSGSYHLVRLENLNELSREVCEQTIPVDVFAERVRKIMKITPSEREWIVGSILAASAFAVFFGGRWKEGFAAALIGLAVAMMKEYIARYCLNGVAYQFVVSFAAGTMNGILAKLIPSLQSDKSIIGVIMLLIPGVAFTNSFRDLLLGDTISGAIRFIEAIVLAAVLASGIICSVWLMRVF